MIFTTIANGGKLLIGVLGDLGKTASATFSYLGNQSNKDVAKLLFGFKQISEEVRSFSQNELTSIIGNYNKLRLTVEDGGQLFDSLSFDQKWLKDYLKNLNGAEATIEGITEASNKAKVAQEGMAVASQAAAFGIKLLQSAASFGAMLILTATIQAVVKAFDDWIHRIEIQQQKVKDIESEYQSLTSEIESLNGELDSTKQKIDELNSKPNLSFLDKDELSNLKETNKELETRIALLEKEEQITAKRLAEESQRLYNQTYGKKPVSQTQIDDYVTSSTITGNNAILLSDEHDISSLMAAYQQFLTLKEQAESSEDIEHYSSILTEIESQLLKATSDLQSVRDNIAQLQNPTEDQKKILNEVANSIDLINSLLIPEKWNNIKFNEIYNADEFKTAREEVEKLAQSGELTVEKFKEVAPALATAFEGAKISATDAVDNINASVQNLGAGDGVDNLTSKINSLIDCISKYQSATNEFEKAHWAEQANAELSKLKEQAEKGAISWDEYGDAVRRVNDAISDNDINSLIDCKIVRLLKHNNKYMIIYFIHSKASERNKWAYIKNKNNKWRFNYSMYDKSIKTIAFRVNEEFHMNVKIQAAIEKKSLQEYIVEVLTRDMENKKTN